VLYDALPEGVVQHGRKVIGYHEDESGVTLKFQVQFLSLSSRGDLLSFHELGLTLKGPGEFPSLPSDRSLGAMWMSLVSL
jgi:hypothetical protein